MSAGVAGLAAYSPDRRLSGPLGLAATGDRLAVVHATAEGQDLLLVDLTTGAEREVALHARGVASVDVGDDGLVRAVIDSADGPALVDLDWHGEPRTRPVPVRGEWFVRGEPLSPSGRLLAYGWYDAGTGRRGLDVAETATLSRVHELPGPDIVVPSSWRPDETALACLTGGHGRIPAVVVVRWGPGGLRSEALTHSDRWVPGPWSDDTTLWALTDADADRVHLRRLQVDGRSEREALPPGEVEAVAHGAEATWVSVNDAGFSRLFCLTGSAWRPVDAPDGVVTRLVCTRDGRVAAWRLQTATAPAEIHQARVDDLVSRPAVRARFRGAVDTVPARLLRCAAPDGRTVPAVVITPPAPRLVVVSVHNGPEAQERPKLAHSGLYQHLAAHGAVVVAPNLGGSIGAGRAEADRVVDDWGGRDLDDLDAVLERVETDHPGLPVVLYGVSYGGFVVLHALARHGERLAAAACVAAPCNLANFVERVPSGFAERICAPTRTSASRARYLWSRSPMAVADRIRTPLLLVHGDLDTWVPVEDAERLAEVVRASGTSVTVRRVPDAGHHLGRHGRAELERVAQFLLAARDRAPLLESR